MGGIMNQTELAVTKKEVEKYRAKNNVKILTATALFDGHDAAINIMRRIMQATGAEVVHLGHNRSVGEIVKAAIEEDVQSVALTSYQGGHMEFFTYTRELLDKNGAKHVKIYGGGGGVIVKREIEELHRRGIDRIFSPEDGKVMGLQGMINVVMQGSDYDITEVPLPEGEYPASMKIARGITYLELGKKLPSDWLATSRDTPIIGFTGPGGAGKSSLLDEIILRFLLDFSDKKVAVLCIDPTRRTTGGALLGDRIRYNSAKNERVFIRSVATRDRGGSEIFSALPEVIDWLKRQDFDLIFVETAGIGQADTAIVDLVDISVYVMTAEYGAPSQLEKIAMLDFADFVVINKFSKRGSKDALREVRKALRRNRMLFDTPLEELPVFGTNASFFNDEGVNSFYAHLIALINSKCNKGWRSNYPVTPLRYPTNIHYIVPPERERYLSEAAQEVRGYRKWVESQSDIASKLQSIEKAIEELGYKRNENLTPYREEDFAKVDLAAFKLMERYNSLLKELDKYSLELLKNWNSLKERYKADTFTYKVRNKDIKVKTFKETLSELKIPRVALPEYKGWREVLRWCLKENVPGAFPFTAGVFPFKRTFEDPTRMFAGEGSAERTNKRFHYLAKDQPFARLSTAFDSITLYGHDPDTRPDIYGKIGESGVSIFSVEEMEQLYAGFDLRDPKTSVSMTINGPAPTILAFFFNAAIRQQCRKFLKSEGRLKISDAEIFMPDRNRGSSWEEVRKLLTNEEYEAIKADTLRNVRGTVQADILKEDQGQNTCIFSIEFALKMLGDVQEYFIENNVRNFYSISISGYHIAEAGANPIHQLAFTLANGLTYVEYYRSRGMDIDSFAPNFSFFFSNGMDTEYSVIGRVARRIWAIVVRNLYGGNERSQKLKYHIQTSGRSLHAMEIEFNDIRTTLQALIAILDNAQSLHTNAYDEAITTPTEESVRRALAIQLIINKEFGLVFCENATQGSFIIEQLTDLVEEEVLKEFDRLTERGGVLGAMEMHYQRSVIQDDSLKYEHMKLTGELPIIGVNTFLSDTSVMPDNIQLSRATREEKDAILSRLRSFKKRYKNKAEEALEQLKRTVLEGKNIFATLMDTAQYATLGQITDLLYRVGGEYRRNI